MGPPGSLDALCRWSLRCSMPGPKCYRPVPDRTMDPNLRLDWTSQSNTRKCRRGILPRGANPQGPSSRKGSFLAEPARKQPNSDLHSGPHQSANPDTSHHKSPREHILCRHVVGFSRRSHYRGRECSSTWPRWPTQKHLSLYADEYRYQPLGYHHRTYESPALLPESHHTLQGRHYPPCWQDNDPRQF
jgi:hypothetical protein